MPTNPVTAAERPTACPSCGTTVRADVSWCTLCYASLVPEVPALPLAPPASDVPVSDFQVSDTQVSVVPDRDVPAAAVANSGSPASDVDVVAGQLLAELAASREPEPGWMRRLPKTPGGRAVAIVGGAVAASLLLLVLMTLLGLFL